MKQHARYNNEDLPFLFSYCCLLGAIGAEGGRDVFLWNIAHM